MDTLTVTLRTAIADDRPFLARLFAACRADDFAPLGEPTANRLLQTQFDGQYASYHEQFDPAGDHIIMLHAEPIGRIWVNSQPDAWRLVDIALLPEHRSQGVASTLLRDLLDQAKANSATVRLYVRTDNVGAQRLYERLGFTVTESMGSDLQMSA
jgi:ribosomal protein S18 acetylase RimI-like enzyme